MELLSSRNKMDANYYPSKIIDWEYSKNRGVPTTIKEEYYFYSITVEPIHSL